MVQQLVGSSSLGLGKLIDGKNQFIHIRYSANANGLNMTTEIQADTKYIGIATNSSETAPTSPSDYSWGRFVGTPGASSYTWIRYSSNADGSNMTAIPNEETKYIGVAITSEDSAPTDYTKYSWALFRGSDGRGVKKTEVSYQKSTSGTVIPTGTWLAGIPSLNEGEYLWTRTLFTYTDGTTTSTYNVSRNGMSGLGIARTDVHYQKSTSGTVAPTGTWTVTIPTVRANEYLWTRTTITYTDDSTSVSYSVGKMGADGKDAQLLYLTASSQIQAFDKDNQPKTTQPITISAKLQNASGTATFVAIPYIGNTAQTPITLGGTGNDRTLLPSQWTDPKWTIIAITATLGSLTDTISVNKVKDGESGETPVVHIAWADSADGSVGFTLELPTNKIPKYRGYYVDYSTVASTDPKKYKWERNPDDTGAEVDKAMTAVESAVANAEEAERLAATASQTATIAKQEASAAQNAASMAQGEVSRIEGVVVGVQGDVDTALQEVAGQAADLQATKETLELNYAKKTEVSDVQAALTTEISKKVGELQTTVSQTYAAKNDVVSMEGHLQSQITQTAGEVSSVVGKVDKLEADTTEAQKKVDEALEKSAAAQATASQAQAYADAADKKVAAAQTDLNEAKQNLVNTINRVDATEADIAEAQLKVESAQAAVAQAQEDAAEAALAASNAQAAADKAQQDVAALTKTVSSQSTRIDQTSNRIDLVASGITEVGNKLDNLQVGNRNLALNSGREVMNKDYRLSAYYISPSEGEVLSNGCGYLVEGKKYTIVICLTTDSTINEIDLLLSSGYRGLGRISPEKNKKQVVSLDFIARYYGGRYPSDNPGYARLELYRYPDPTSISDAQYVTVHWVKIVDASGVVVKDWSPAPEDTQDQIDGINSNIAANYYQKTTVDSKLSTAVSGITAQYTKDITTKLGNYYDKSTIDSKLTIDGQGIATYVKSTQSKLDNLQVGGRNLLINSEKYTKDKPWQRTISGGDDYTITDMYFPIAKNRTYTFQFCTNRPIGWHQVDGTAKGTTHIILFLQTKETSEEWGYKRIIDLNNSSLQTKNDKYYQTFTIPTDYDYVRALVRIDGHADGNKYDLKYWNLQAEEGTKDSTWEPPIESMATLTQYTEVKQLADRISSTVYDSSTGLVTKTNQLAGKYAIQNLNIYGDVLSSLNLNGGNVRIKGELIDLDGNVRIQNAFVTNLKANSILANEITAKATTVVNAKIANLDAGVITTGILKGTNLSLNLGTGEVQFQKGRIQAPNNTLDIQVNTGIMKVLNTNGEGVTFQNGNLYFSNTSVQGYYGSIKYNQDFGGPVKGVKIDGYGGVILASRSQKDTLFNGYLSDIKNGSSLSLEELSDGTGYAYLLSRDSITIAVNKKIQDNLGYSYFTGIRIDKTIGTLTLASEDIRLVGDDISLNNKHLLVYSDSVTFGNTTKTSFTGPVSFNAATNFYKPVNFSDYVNGKRLAYGKSMDITFELKNAYTSSAYLEVNQGTATYKIPLKA